MKEEDSKGMRLGMILLSGISLLPVLADYTIVNGFYSFDGTNVFTSGLKDLYDSIQPDMFLFRIISFVLTGSAFILVVPMTRLEERRKKRKKIPINLLLLLPFLTGYTYGFIGEPVYDTFVFPIWLFFTLYFSGKVFPYIRYKNVDTQKSIFDKLPRAEKGHGGFIFETDKGKIDMPMPHAGILTQGSQRSGKTASWGEPVIFQSITKGYAAYIYDYKGNEHPLATCALASWLEAKKRLKGQKLPSFNIISLLNPLFLTGKVNPIDPQYLKNYPFCKSICSGFYKNLDISSIKNFDFWAKNGLSIVSNTAYFLKENYPQYCSLPYLITLLLQDLEDLITLLSEDRYVGYRMKAVMAAYRKEAGSQIAGIEGSLQTILDTAFTPEVFWATHCDEGNYIDLRVNDPKDPKIIVTLSNEAIYESLTPIIGAIDSTVAILINDNEDFHPCLISFDEIGTKYVKDLDHIPATMGSKKVILHILFQEESQLISKYGKEEARKILNMGNQIYCRSNDGESSKKVSEMFGEYDKIRETQSISDSGVSFSETTEKRKRITQDMVETQAVGHACGKIMGSEPNLFYAQMKDASIHKLLNIKKSELPDIGMPGIEKYVNTDDNELATKVLGSLMKMQFDKIINDVEDIIEPIKSAREQRELEEKIKKENRY